MVAVRHAVEALNGLHHARQAVLAIHDPEHLGDRDRLEVRERARELCDVVESIEELEAQDDESVDDTIKSLEEYLTSSSTVNTFPPQRRTWIDWQTNEPIDQPDTS